MSESTNHIISLSRSGQTQTGRIKDVLLPENIVLDERTVSDFILFSQKFSKYIKYYNQKNEPEGNWETFWNRDLSAILAQISGYPINEIYDFYGSLKRHLVNLIEDNNIAPAVQQEALKRHFRLLFQLPVIALRRLSKVHSMLSQHQEERSQLEYLYTSELKEVLEKHLSYFKGAHLHVLGLPAFDTLDISVSTFTSGVENIYLPDIIKSELYESTSLTTADFDLFSSGDDWSTLYTGQTADENPFIEGIDLEQIINDALNYNLFTNNLNAFFEGLVSAINLYKDQLSRHLESFDAHSPHFALWICFAKLLSYQQKTFNSLPRKHLEYYFREILEQKLLAPEANKAHLLIELNKNVDQHLLANGTLFRAAKDALGNKVNYRLLDDIIINNAQITEMRSMHIGSNEFPIATKKVDTLDGLEEPLSDEAPHWKAFFEARNEEDKSTLKARLGFALADRSLFLKEGTRTIHLEDFNGPKGIGLKSSDIDVYYTGEKKWEKASQVKLKKAFRRVKGITITITEDQDPCVPFDKSIHVDDDHKDDFAVDLPMIKIVVKQSYQRWKQLKIANANLFAKVGKVKDLVVLNKNGVADLSKAFPLFGSIPDKNPSCVIGSNEVFSKKIDEISLHLTWQDTFIGTEYFKKLTSAAYDVKFQYLKNKNWNGEKDYTNNRYHLFNDNNKEKEISFSAVMKGVDFLAEQKIVNDNYHINSKEGFIKLQSKENFGHLDYPLKLSEELIKKADNASYEVNIKEPYTAVVEEMHLSYTSSSESPSYSFELHPFGYKSSATTAVPAYDDRGELYIGVKDLKANETLSCLFQVKQGMANPLAGNPQIKWSYLMDNKWMDDGLEIEDKTDQLLSSGIISIVTPDKLSDQNTLFESGLHWFKLSVRSHVDALNHLYSIDSQACLVEFIDQENDPAFLNNQSPAGTISKLEIAEPEVKKVDQKYSTFGGRKIESDRHFYTRVSERLRHKDRAIQLWDYEHLILQNFPSIYRVKCLNHTRVDDNYRPGNVTIVPLPQLESFSADPLKPYTNKKTRLDIYRFIKARISPFVCLNVIQPKLESIQIECKVKFNAEISNEIFYKAKLKTELIEFLTPWTYDVGEDISFEGKWYKADIINFIDERSYVHYIKDVKMFHHPDAENENRSNSLVDVELAKGTSQRSILVSSRNHIITDIETEQQTTDNQNCVCADEII